METGTKGKIMAEQDKMQNIVAMLAKKHFGVETHETRHSDRLDFYDCSVASIKSALEETFKMGVELGLSLNQKGDVR